MISAQIRAAAPLKHQLNQPRHREGTDREPSQQTGAGGRTVVREDSAVVACCARVRSGGIIIGVRRGRPRKDLGALSL
jgi:hypothetical protein